MFGEKLFAVGGKGCLFRQGEVIMWLSTLLLISKGLRQQKLRLYLYIRENGLKFSGDSSKFYKKLLMLLGCINFCS